MAGAALLQCGPDPAVEQQTQTDFSAGVDELIAMRGQEGCENMVISGDSRPSHHSCTNMSTPETKPTDLDALRKWESDRLKAEQSFYDKYGKKPFTCPKTGIKMVWLVDEKYRRKGFWISAHEISRVVYAKLMNEKTESRQERDLPITNLSGKQMLAFCEKLTECWRRSRPEKLPDIYRFDLPTGDEWNFAAGGYNSYRGMDSSKANFNGSFPPSGTKVRGPNLGRLAPVTDYTPNKNGVFNMWGNAREAQREDRRNKNPTFRAGGGSYLSKGNDLDDDDYSFKPAEDIGFRVVVGWIGPGPSPLDDPD